MPRASADFISQAANAGDASLASPVNLMAKVDLNSADPTTIGSTGALGSKQSAGSWSASASGTPKTNGTAMSYTTDGSTPYGYFSSWDSVGTAYGIGGQLASVVTAASITIAAGALSYQPS